MILVPVRSTSLFLREEMHELVKVLVGIGFALQP